MKLRYLALLSFLLLFAVSQLAAAELPPGKWWRKPEIVRMLQLTDDQQRKLDGVFRTRALQLIDLKANVEKQSVELHSELDQPVLNRDAILRSAQKLNAARNRLFEQELLLLVDMRQVLTNEQWSHLRSSLENGQPGNLQRRGQR